MVLDSDSCYNRNKNNDEMEDNVRITSMGSGEVSVNWFVCWEWKEIRKESDMSMYQEDCVFQDMVYDVVRKDGFYLVNGVA